MAKWLHNGPCPRCNSRDNLATYDDGSTWCWGCSKRSPRTKLPSFSVDEEPPAHRPLPDDITTDYGPDSIAWFSSFGLTVEEMLRNNVKYSPSKNQTIFTFPDTGLWQARNHWAGAKTRYFTSGNSDNILPIFGSGGTLVLTEDCLSVIKVSRHQNDGSGKSLKGPTRAAMPLLGATLATKKIMALKALNYQQVFVWLDHDMFDKAVNIAHQFKMIGLSARALYTDLDPKCLTDEEIAQVTQ